MKTGDMIYGMRVVKTYDESSHTEETKFNGFEGIVVYDTWTTGEWIIVLGRKDKKGIYHTRRIGIIENISNNCTGKEVAEYIKDQINRISKKIPEIHLKQLEKNIAIDEIIAQIIENN